MRARVGAVLALLLAACAAPDRVVLLPDDSGKVGKLNVAGRNGDTLLDAAYDTATVGGDSARRSTSDPAELGREFGPALAALPPAPQSYLLYFASDSDVLNADSRSVVQNIRAAIANRPAAEVVVIGHTDTQGSDEYNDRLSLQRARAVRDQLVALGFDAARISVAGRGKREPLVPTADGMPEPVNRRVEILVR